MRSPLLCASALATASAVAAQTARPELMVEVNVHFQDIVRLVQRTS